MYLNEALQTKWAKVLDHKGSPALTDPNKRSIMATVLENQVNEARSAGRNYISASELLGEAAPTNSTGSEIDNFDPVLISLVRRSMPNLIAYDLCGVQPMTGPTGLIFALRSRYNSQTGAEALFNEANTTFSGSAAGNTASRVASNNQTGATPTGLSAGSEYTYGKGMSTASAEKLGDSTTNAFNQMAFSIERITVTAVSRALQAKYSMELAQDLRAVHGLDAETELSNILSSEILADINREVVRAINQSATVGAQENVAASGTFNLDTDANGRWMVEKFKGMIFQLEREAHQIAKSTRRGKGNVMLCTSDVASALSMAGVLDYTPALKANLQVDDTGNTFAGTIGGRIKVYIDPYFASSSGNQYATLGYKGQSAFDAGLFYCPYVPLTMVRSVGENTYQPGIGFKTRYGMVANPFATAAADGVVSFANKNVYYRRVTIANIM